MTIYLVQCGQTDWQAEGRMQGRLELPLSAAGLEQADSAGRKLADVALSAVYCADEEACVETARRVAAGHRGCKIRKLDGLQEVDLGLWQGMRPEQIRQRQPRVYRQWIEEPATVTPPQGESFEQALARVADALATIGRRSGDRTVAVVAPPLLAGLIRCQLTGGRLAELWKLVGGDPGQPEHFEVSPAEKE